MNIVKYPNNYKDVLEVLIIIVIHYTCKKHELQKIQYC